MIQASPRGSSGASTFYILILPSHSQEHLRPSPLNFFFNLLSSPVPPCPRLVPESPCATPTLNPFILQVPIRLSLWLRPLPSRTGSRQDRQQAEFPLHLSPRQHPFRSRLKQVTGEKLEPSKARRTPSAAAPDSAQAPPATPANSANSPLPPPLDGGPSPCLQPSSCPLFLPKLAWLGLLVSL